ncbi:MAG TPA: acireductone dioxygenase [Planctomycetota bacterium]|nr:acireductone dioxygenase [Planctomycetota bacterium]
MAVISIKAENRQIKDPVEIAAYLAPLGITYERWPVAERVNPDASQEEILKAYAPEVERLKARGGYVTADVINVTPDTPNLDAMLNKFNKEHTHSEDEVRFILKGSGIFHIHPKNGPVIAVQTDAGDLINLPAGTEHWFDLCSDRAIKAIRLFKDPSGWSPKYVDNGVHADYEPICFGPRYLPLTDKPYKTVVGAK